MLWSMDFFMANLREQRSVELCVCSIPSIVTTALLNPKGLRLYMDYTEPEMYFPP